VDYGASSSSSKASRPGARDGNELDEEIRAAFEGREGRRRSDVVVLDIKPSDRRVSLGMKQAQPDPCF